MESPITVAFADDHTAVRKGIIALLEERGDIRVTIDVNNGCELMNELKGCPLPDVVLLDIQMPQMDGFETVKALKKISAHIKILVITAFDTELYLIRMIRLGANGYLLKSCHPEEIRQALITIHRNGFYYADAPFQSFYEQVQQGIITLPRFTENEITFLKYCPSDMSYSEIATCMQTSLKAVEGYRNRICQKLHVKSRVGLALRAIEMGFAATDNKIEPDRFIRDFKK